MRRDNANPANSAVLFISMLPSNMDDCFKNGLKLGGCSGGVTSLFLSDYAASLLLTFLLSFKPVSALGSSGWSRGGSFLLGKAVPFLALPLDP